MQVPPQQQQMLQDADDDGGAVTDSAELVPVPETDILMAWMCMQLASCRACFACPQISLSTRKVLFWGLVVVVALALSFLLPSLVAYLARCTEDATNKCADRSSVLLGVIFFAVWISEVVVIFICAMVSIFFTQYCFWLRASYQQARQHAIQMQSV